MAHTMRTGAEHYVYRYNVLCVPVAAVLTLQLSVCGGLVSDVPLNALFASHLRRAGRVGDPLGSPASRALAIWLPLLGIRYHRYRYARLARSLSHNPSDPKGCIRFAFGAN